MSSPLKKGPWRVAVEGISCCRLQYVVVLGHHGDLCLGRSSLALAVDVDTCPDIAVFEGLAVKYPPIVFQASQGCQVRRLGSLRFFLKIKGCYKLLKAANLLSVLSTATVFGPFVVLGVLLDMMSSIVPTFDLVDEQSWWRLPWFVDFMTPHTILQRSVLS